MTDLEQQILDSIEKQLASQAFDSLSANTFISTESSWEESKLNLDDFQLLYNQYMRNHKFCECGGSFRGFRVPKVLSRMPILLRHSTPIIRVGV